MKRLLAVMFVVMAMLVPATAVFGHGYTEAPTSRALWCKQGYVQGCGAAQWEPQSIEGPKGFPGAGPRDGQICSGGHDRFAELDDPALAWPLQEVSAGAEFEFKWHLTASHKTTKWEYFVTRDSWDGTQALTRTALESQPFFTEYSDGQSYPPAETVHTGTLPSDKTGRHMILGVWTIADTSMAFYQCADVNFN
jgi:chitin-binding protein